MTALDHNLSGDLNLQDGQFSCDDLNLLLGEEELKAFKESIESSSIKLFLTPKNLDMNKGWKALEKSLKNIQLVSLATLSEAPEDAWQPLISGIAEFLNEQPVDQIMETSNFTGTLRIQRPTLYIFPALEGDSAFFTINGYSMLINGGYDRVRPCFWKFVSMLQQIDSVLITHSDADALGGLSSFFAKKMSDPEAKPTVLTVLANLVSSSKSSEASTAANLIAAEIATSKPTSNSSDVELILEAIERLQIKLMPLVKTEASVKSNSHQSKPEHINLYYKLGQGSLDLYVLSPFANSSDYKEFVQLQQNHVAKLTHQKSHLSVNQIFRQIPTSHLCSAVVLLVWSPVPNSREPSNALRLLFTGNAPQNVVLNALEKAKDLELLTAPVFKIKAPEVPVLKKTEKAASNATSQTNTSMNAAKPVHQPNTKPVSGPTNVLASNEPTPKQNGRVSIAHASTSAKETTAKTNATEKSVEPKTDRAPKPPKPPVPAPSTSTSNGVSKEAAAAAPAITTKKPAPSVEPKKKTLTKETSAKESLNKEAANKEVTAAKEEEKEEKVIKEETNKATVSKPLSSSKPSAPKEVKATKSETSASTSSTNNKPSSAPIASKSETQATKPQPAPAPKPSAKQPSSQKATASSSASSKDPTKKSTSKKESIEPKKEVRDAQDSKITGKKNSKLDAAKAQAKANEEAAAEAKLPETTTEQKAVTPTDVSVATAVETLLSFDAPVNTPAPVVESVVLESPVETVAEMSSEFVAPTLPEVVPEASSETEAASEIVTEVEMAREEIKEVASLNSSPIEKVSPEDIADASDIEVVDEALVKDVEEEEKTEEAASVEAEVEANLVEILDDAEEIAEPFRQEVVEQDQPQETQVHEEVQVAEEKEEEEEEEEAKSEGIVLETCESCDIIHQSNNGNYSEWPNLSPVKKETNDNLIDVGGEELNGVDNRDSSAIESPEEDSSSDSQVRPPNDLPLLSKNDSENILISDPQDLIASPIACDSQTGKSFDGNDIMTRSFIDDGSQSNPFSAPITNEEGEVKLPVKPAHNDSINDLNKTHELFADESQDELSANSSIAKKETSFEDDKIIDILSTLSALTIESKLNALNGHENEMNGHRHQENGHHHNGDLNGKDLNGQDLNGQEQEEPLRTQKVIVDNTSDLREDPSKWDLLQLPRPVNPGDALVSIPSTASSSLLEKKSTPNGKKASIVGPQSPSQANAPSTNSEASKPATKAQTNNSHVKAKATNGLVSHPVYVEVSHVPAHGNASYVDADFFKKVRSRYYILSTQEPSEQILNSLVEAKETWEDKSCQVSIIPTYESEVIRHWFLNNEDNLTKLKIDILPAANLASLTMDSPELSCQVYKLEF